MARYSVPPQSARPRTAPPLVFPTSPPAQGKTNFFERRVGEYQKAGVMGGTEQGGGRKFSLDEDF
jgi:hypothetical protein